jgi:hypothetical protein
MPGRSTPGSPSSDTGLREEIVGGRTTDKRSQVMDIKLFRITGDLYMDRFGNKYRKYSELTYVVNQETGALRKSITYLPEE